MKISLNGINLIKKFEGCVLQVYLDVVGVKTLGYGHTGADVNAMPVGARISQNQADDYLIADLVRFENNVNKYDPIYHWSQNEYDALVSFAFNLGSIDKLTNNGQRNKLEIAQKILEYNRAGGKVVQGLTYRRQKERELFLSTQIASDVPIIDMTYQIGKTYILDANLYIRKEPKGEALKYDAITANAKGYAHFDNYGQAVLESGTKVTCKGIRKIDDSTWMQIPSGWICAREGETVYII